MHQNSRGVHSVDFSDDDIESNIEEIEQQVQQAQDLLQECRKRRLDIKSETRALIKDIRSFDVMIPKIKLEIEGFETTRKELTKLVPELQLQCQSTLEDKEEKNSLQMKVQKCQDDMEAGASFASRLEEVVSKLQRDILDAGGPHFKNQKLLCEKILRDLSAAENKLNATNIEVKSSEKAESKSISTKITLHDNLSMCQQNLDLKEEEFKSLESGALDVMAAYEQVKVIEAEKRAALEMASNEADELKRVQTETRCKEIDLLGQVEALEKQINDNRKKLKNWEKEIARLKEVDDDIDYDDENFLSGVGDNTLYSKETTMNESDALSNANSLSKLPYSILEKYDPDDIKQSIEILEAERNLLAKNANMSAIAEYRKKEADYLSR